MLFISSSVVVVFVDWYDASLSPPARALLSLLLLVKHGGGSTGRQEMQYLWVQMLHLGEGKGL